MLLLMNTFIISLLLTTLIASIGMLLSKKSFFDRELMSPFECGFSPLMETRGVFSQRFFILALIFVIFDVEIIMLLPFTLNMIFNYYTMSAYYFFLFLTILTVGLFHEWNQSTLEWIK